MRRPRKTVLAVGANFQAPLDDAPKRNAPAGGAEALHSRGETNTTHEAREKQANWRAAIAAALPGQLDWRAKDAVCHRAQTVREAMRMASRWAAERKYRRSPWMHS